MFFNMFSMKNRHTRKLNSLLFSPEAKLESFGPKDDRTYMQTVTLESSKLTLGGEHVKCPPLCANGTTNLAELLEVFPALAKFKKRGWTIQEATYQLVQYANKHTLHVVYKPSPA